MAQLQNITSGPKGFYTKAGELVMVEAGALTPEGAEFGENEPSKLWFGKPGATQADAVEASITGPANDEQLEALRAAFDAEKRELLGRAEDAERQVEQLTSQTGQLTSENEQLRQQLAALDRDGDGKAGGSEPQDPPALTGKNKTELLEIAGAEGVAEAKDKDGNAIPVAEATNAQIVEAIEAKRAA